MIKNCNNCGKKIKLMWYPGGYKPYEEDEITPHTCEAKPVRSFAQRHRTGIRPY